MYRYGEQIVMHILHWKMYAFSARPEIYTAYLDTHIAYNKYSEKNSFTYVFFCRRVLPLLLLISLPLEFDFCWM